MDDETPLKPCPFCGSPASLVMRPTFKIYRNGLARAKEPEYFIRCQNVLCAADVGVFVNRNCRQGEPMDDGRISDGGLARDEAVAAWNRRVSV